VLVFGVWGGLVLGERLMEAGWNFFEDGRVIFGQGGARLDLGDQVQFMDEFRLMFWGYR